MTDTDIKRPLLSTVFIELEPEDNPDLSYLGRYTMQKISGAIDRQARGDMGRDEKQYFVPANPDNAEQDYARAEAYNRGDWHCIGIMAAALIQTATAAGDVFLTRVRSSGLWGVESDSDRDYLEGIANAELAELRDRLEALGVDLTNWDLHAQLAANNLKR